MPGSNVLVCLKWVSTRTEVDPLTGAASTDKRFSGISPADSSALEWGLRIAASLQGTLTAATVGPPEAEAVLTDAIACGASRAVRFESLSNVASEAVAAALATVGADHQVIVCGDYSIDRGSGSVPAFIAHRLGLPQALGLIEIEAQRGQIVGTRRLDQGRRERLVLRLPIVLSVEPGIDLRRAGLAATLSAGTAESEVLDPPAMADPPTAPVSVGTAPFEPRARVVAPPKGDAIDRVRELAGLNDQPSGARIIEANPDEAADLTIAQLREWGYLK